MVPRWLLYLQLWDLLLDVRLKEHSTHLQLSQFPLENFPENPIQCLSRVCCVPLQPTNGRLALFFFLIDKLPLAKTQRPFNWGGKEREFWNWFWMFISSLCPGPPWSFPPFSLSPSDTEKVAIQTWLFFSCWFSSNALFTWSSRKLILECSGKEKVLGNHCRKTPLLSQRKQGAFLNERRDGWMKKHKSVGSCTLPSPMPCC